MNTTFGRHEVWISSACLHLGKEGVTFKVKAADGIVGTLVVTDSHVTWKHKGSKNAQGMTWGKFVEKVAIKNQEVER